MTQKDLKTGMIVTTRKGNEYMIVKDIVQTDCIGHSDVALNLNNHQYFPLNYDDNLNDRAGEDWDAMTVETITDYYDVTNFRNAIRKVIWERPSEKKKYTYAQLKEILGEEFEIVKGD